MICYKCEKREVGCHGKCKEYLAEVEENKKAYKERLKSADLGAYMSSIKLREIKCLRKREKY